MKISKQETKTRVGDKRVNDYGETMEIIKYDNSHNIIVKISDESGNKYIVKTDYQKFNLSNLSHPYRKTVVGVGFIGEYVYSADIKNMSKSKSYKTWSSMIGRCYNKNDHQYNCYGNKGATVAVEWHNYSNFLQWYNKNYYSIKEEKMELDKDILLKNNKIYCSDNCCFIPQRINFTIAKGKSDRDCPIGIKYKKDKGIYESYCTKNGKRYYLYSGGNVDVAFKLYKNFKENAIKELADEYKEYLPENVYKGLYNYKVEKDS